MAKEERIELESPRMPLEPIVSASEPGNEEIWAEYNRLLAEYRRLDGIKHDQVKGASLFLKEDSTVYTPDEYVKMLTGYRKKRKRYLAAYDGLLETIEMVREKMRKLIEEEEKTEAESDSQDELPEPPELEEIDDEPWDQFSRRFEEYSKKSSEWFEKLGKQTESSMVSAGFLSRRLEEMGKFPELEYELEKRLRYTYIDPKTGEQLYRPDDEVGEGLICVGSRDHKPVLKDE